MVGTRWTVEKKSWFLGTQLLDSDAQTVCGVETIMKLQLNLKLRQFEFLSLSDDGIVYSLFLLKASYKLVISSFLMHQLSVLVKSRGKQDK